MSNRATRSPGDVAAVLLLAVTAIVVVAVSLGRISGPVGDSDDGINTAVWATNAQALRHDGVIASKLGGVRADGSRYATHPPMIVVETAAAQAVASADAGHRPWADRAPAWLGTLVALALIFRLLRTGGFEPVAAAAAVALVALTAMVTVYGPMLDTPVTALPFGLAVALCWFRDWDGRHRVPAFLAALAAVGAGLSGWQAALLAGLCGLTLAIRALRSQHHAIRDALPYLIGTAVGVGLSLAWSIWVYGSIHALTTKFLGRSGTSSGVGLGDMVSFQIPWIFNLLGLSVIGLGGCIAAIRDRALRPLALLSLGSVALYAVIFRQAAAGHQYWNYWAVFPAAVGWAYLARALATKLRRETSHALAPVLALVVVVVIVGGFNLLRPSLAAQLIDDGHHTADIVTRATFPPGQTTLPYVGEPDRPDAWVRLDTTMAPVLLASARDLTDLRDRRPDDLVLVLGSCADTDAAGSFCHRVTDPGDGWTTGDRGRPARLVRAADIGSG